jgi:VanZ family protein
VAWLEGRNGLRFSRYGSLISPAAFSAQPDQNEITIEIWAQPRLVWYSGVLVSFTDAGDTFRSSVRQSQTDLKLFVDRKICLEVDDVFPRKGAVFLTITSGPQGAAVYTNGQLLRALPRVHVPAEAFSGRLIVGDSAGQSDDWRGQLYALALYRRALTPAQVLKNYAAWTHSGRPEIPVDERTMAVYLFDERSGNVVHNQTPSGLNLEIPKKYQLVNQLFLEPVWSEFEMTESYWSAALKNVVGLIPLGFCFCSLFCATFPIKRPRLTTVLIGTAVSITIEVLQAYLPRDSGTTDILTNTFGTWVGVVAYDLSQPIVVRLLPKHILTMIYR